MLAQPGFDLDEATIEGTRADQQRLKSALGGPCYDNRELFPVFECDDFETLLERLAAIGVKPHCDYINKRALVVWHAGRSRRACGVVLSRRLGIVRKRFGSV